MPSHQNPPSFFYSNCNPNYHTEIEHIWGQIFLSECEKLAKYERHLDDEELEAKAEERTNKYIYLYHKDRLMSYWMDQSQLGWRQGLN